MAKKDFRGAAESIFNSERETDVLRAEDAPRKSVQAAEAVFDLSFAVNENAPREELESGIVQTMRGQEMSRIAISIALERIERDSLWLYDAVRDEFGNYVRDENGHVKTVRSKYKAITEYWDELLPRINITYAQLYQYLRAGRLFQKYRAELEAVNFRERGQYTKLLQLDDVMKNVENNLVSREEFRRVLAEGTVAAFKDLAMREPTQEQPKEYRPKHEIHVEKNTLKLDGKDAVTVSPDMPDRYRKEIITATSDTVRRIDNELEIVGMEVSRSEAKKYERVFGQVRDILDRKKLPVILEIDIDSDEEAVKRAAEKELATWYKKYHQAK